MPFGDDGFSEAILAGVKLKALNQQLIHSKLENQYLVEDRQHTINMQGLEEALGHSHQQYQDTLTAGAQVETALNKQRLSQGAEEFPVKLAQTKAQTKSIEANTSETGARQKQTEASTGLINAETSGKLIENTKNQYALTQMLGESIGEQAEGSSPEPSPTGGVTIGPADIAASANHMIEALGIPDTPVTHTIYQNLIGGKVAQTQREIGQRKQLTASLEAERKERTSYLNAQGKKLQLGDVLDPGELEQYKAVSKSLGELSSTSTLASAITKQQTGKKLSADEKTILDKYNVLKSKATEFQQLGMSRLQAEGSTDNPVKLGARAQKGVVTVPTISSQAEYDALPAGAQYIDKANGQTYTKKAKK